MPTRYIPPNDFLRMRTSTCVISWQKFPIEGKSRSLRWDFYKPMGSGVFANYSNYRVYLLKFKGGHGQCLNTVSFKVRLDVWFVALPEDLPSYC